MSKDIKEVLEAYHLARNKYDEDVSVPQGEALAEIKRIIEEAKPENVAMMVRVMGYDSYDDAKEHGEAIGHNEAINQYQNNLLKALGE